MPIDESPRHDGPDDGEPRQLQPPPEAPPEEGRGERVVEKPSGGRARGFDRPVEGDERGGPADRGLAHLVDVRVSQRSPLFGLIRYFAPVACLP
jgi:hypothetical protein